MLFITLWSIQIPVKIIYTGKGWLMGLYEVRIWLYVKQLMSLLKYLLKIVQRTEENLVQKYF